MFVNQNLLIDICLHLGSLLAIIIYFRGDLLHFIKNKNFLIKICIATIPIIPVGFIFYQTGIINQLRNLEVIGWTSLIFGIFLYIADKKKITKEINKDFSNFSAVFIGLFQVLALIPGVSRAGIVITASRFLNFDRVDSTKIAFYLSIPALAGASFLSIKDILETNINFNLIFLFSIIFSFFISYLTIKYFLIYVKKFDLKFFVYYRIFLALILFIIIYS